MSQEIEQGDYVARTRPPHSFMSGPPTVIYQVARLYRTNNATWAQVMRCNYKTLTVVPGSRIMRTPVDRLFRIDPLEVMARWGK